MKYVAGSLLTIVLLAGLPGQLVAMRASGTAGPASELHAALTDVLSMPPSDRPTIRYLSLYAVPVEQRPIAREVAGFWVNSLSRRPRIVRPVAVTDTLLRLDLRDYEWLIDAWENLAAKRGYEFVPVWRSLAKTPRDPFQSVAPVLRVESFLAYSSDKPFYDQFLALGKNVQEVQTAQRVRVDDATALRLELYGSKFRSPVALHNRRLIRYPSLTGYWWESQDHLSDFDADNIIENPEKSDHDAGEFIWSLPNGLQGYYIADGKGDAVQVVPAAIAQDYETPSKDVQIYNARSCVGCHALGINAFDSDFAAMIRNGSIKLNSYQQETAQRIEDRFLANLAETFAEDQKRFRLAVEKSCDLAPEIVSHEFRRLTVEYLDQPVDAARAASELGIPLEALPKLSAPYRGKRLTAASFAALLAGQKISRQAWESLYGKAIVLIHQVELTNP